MNADRKPGATGLRALDGLILVCLLVTVWQLLNPPERRIPTVTVAQARPLQLASTVELPAVDWSEARRHVVIAFSTSCQYSVASGDFYRKMSTWLTEHTGQRIMVVAPEAESIIQDWMLSNGIEHFRHVRENFILHGFRLTPTIAFVDSSGVVTDLTVGQLSPDEEAKVLARLAGGNQEPLNIGTEHYTQTVQVQGAV